MHGRKKEGRKGGNIKQESSSVHYFHRPEEHGQSGAADGRTDDLISASLAAPARSIVWFQFGRWEWTWTEAALIKV